MARTEEHEAIEGSPASAPTADLLIALSGAPSSVSEQWNQMADVLLRDPGFSNVAIAVPAEGGRANVAPPVGSPGVQVYPYTAPSGGVVGIPGVVPNSLYRTLSELAMRLQARAVLVISPDMDAPDTANIRTLADAVLNDGSDLCLPLYPTSPTEGLLNRAIFSPLVSALYGKRMKFPLAQDFCVSSRLLIRLASLPAPLQNEISWPSIEAAVVGYTISEAHVSVNHHQKGEGLDLSTVLNAVLGSLYGETERYASLWQRNRGVQPVRLIGWPGTASRGMETIEVAPLRDAFLLGFTNLQEIWSLVLPPVSLLELKRLARLPSESFHMPENLWARVVYDFALAYRLRSINRSHLLGALVPLYLGWVASYAQSLASGGATQSLQDLDRAFEENKSYFVSRWRWPDRFNP